MNVVVTGGSGQLGTILLRRLSADRSVRSIVNLDVRPPIVVGPKIRHVHADVRDPAIQRHFAGADALLHLAFLVTQAASREVMQSVNVEGSKNVLRAAVAEGIKTIVYTSSVAAYGVFNDHPRPIVETTPRRYQSSFAYSATKFEVEAFLDEMEPQSPDVAICRLRPGVLIGARMEHALGRALDARVFPDIGGPPAPVVWDEDVADAALLALKQRARGAFNLVAEPLISSREFASAAGIRYVAVPRSIIKALARLPAELTGVPAVDPTWFEIASAALVVSSEKARTELGWKPRYPTPTDVARRLGEAARGRLDARLEILFRLLTLVSKGMPPKPEAASMEARIHLNITGRGGGDVGLILDGGRLSIQVGSIPRPLTAVITLKTSLLLELLAGKANYATSELTGKLRIEGEPLAGMAVSGIVALFRAHVEDKSPHAWPARRLAKWMEAG